MVHIIVGYGEVGKSLGKVIGKHYWITRNDSNYWGQPVDVVHICIPYTKGLLNEAKFDATVRQWKGLSKLVIVHSSVPVGVCDALGVVHSFITGKHPDLEGGIRTFTKYFGGKNAKKASKIFSNLGLKTKVYKEARTTEAMKLISTTYYGLNIMIEKEIYAWCKENKLDFKAVYSENNKDYNWGYTELGNPEFVRPNLKHIEGKVGGHCIIPNLELIKGFWLGELLKKRNNTY